MMVLRLGNFGDPIDKIDRFDKVGELDTTW